jgi:hypothetical protein
VRKRQKSVGGGWGEQVVAVFATDPSGGKTVVRRLRSKYKRLVLNLDTSLRMDKITVKLSHYRPGQAQSGPEA